MNQRRPVTDPELLSELNSSYRKLKPVTDLELLKELNQPTGESQIQAVDRQLADEEQTNNRPVPQRLPQIQEAFSNPSIMPGFGNLPKQEQLERLKFSQLDPANQGLGGFVPPGTYEHPANRMLGSLAGQALTPEISAGGRFGAPILNALSRIGTGTGASLAYQSPEFKNKEDFTNALSKDLGMNTLLEGITTPFRGVKKAAEIAYPVKYAQQKAGVIRQEYKNAVKDQEEAYRPVMSKYGKQDVTSNPDIFLNLSSKDKRYLTPNVKKSIDNFKEKPNFKNLHDLQSQVGKDYGKVAGNSNQIEMSQTLKNFRDGLKQKAHSFLSKDQEALGQYLKGSDITKNVVEPFKANKDLRAVAYGTRKKLKPEQLQKMLKDANEKIVGTKGANAFTAIPETHPLKNHLLDMDRAIETGKLVESAIPAVTGGILGGLASPSPLGVSSGVVAGSGLGKIGKVLGSPSLGELLQNPTLERYIKNYLSPAYYGAGRASINEFGNK